MRCILAPPQIATQRLSLAPLRPDNAAAFYEYRSDREVSRYQSWEPGSLDEAAQFINGLQSLAFDTPGTWFQLAIRPRDSSLLIGDLGVHFPADDPHQVEIGFTVAPKHQRQGFGIEAVTGLLGFLFGTLQKHRVFASVDPRNEPSIALLKRLEMRQEAHFRESLLINGEWVDDIVFGILASEWKCRIRQSQYSSQKGHNT
jgi:RimJ/RimL family protein N-acetyltransferase